jgi:hypothetical protein
MIALIFHHHTFVEHSNVLDSVCYTEMKTTIHHSGYLGCNIV